MRFKSLFLSLSLIFLSCHKKGEDLFPTTRLGSHAGAGLHISSSVYHDNSLEAFNYASSFEQVELIEMDIQLSADNTWWLFHDVELDVESNGKGRIQLLGDDYLNTINYQSINREKITRLFDLPTELGSKILILDLRETDGSESGLLDSTRLVSNLITIKNHFLNSKLMLVSSTGRFVNTITSLGFEVYLNAQNATNYLQMEGSNVAKGAFFRNSLIEVGDVELMQNYGKLSIIYDIRSPKGIKSALRKSAYCVLTDDIIKGITEKFN